MQHDRRPNERIEVQVGTANVGSLSENGGEACEELRRMIEVCCLQDDKDGDERKDI